MKQKPYALLTKDGTEYTIYKEETNYSVFKEEHSRINRTYMPTKKDVDKFVDNLIKLGYNRTV